MKLYIITHHLLCIYIENANIILKLNIESHFYIGYESKIVPL